MIGPGQPVPCSMAGPGHGQTVAGTGWRSVRAWPRRDRDRDGRVVVFGLRCRGGFGGRLVLGAWRGWRGLEWSGEGMGGAFRRRRWWGVGVRKLRIRALFSTHPRTTVFREDFSRVRRSPRAARTTTSGTLTGIGTSVVARDPTLSGLRVGGVAARARLWVCPDGKSVVDVRLYTPLCDSSSPTARAVLKITHAVFRGFFPARPYSITPEPQGRGVELLRSDGAPGSDLLHAQVTGTPVSTALITIVDHP